MSKNPPITKEIIEERWTKLNTVRDMYAQRVPTDSGYVIDAVEDLAVRDALLVDFSPSCLAKKGFSKVQKLEERAKFFKFISDCAADNRHTSNMASLMLAITLMNGDWEIAMQTAKRLIDEDVANGLIRLIYRATDAAGAMAVPIFIESVENLTDENIVETTEVH